MKPITPHLWFDKEAAELQKAFEDGSRVELAS